MMKEQLLLFNLEEDKRFLQRPTHVRKQVFSSSIPASGPLSFQATTKYSKDLQLNTKVSFKPAPLKNHL